MDINNIIQSLWIGNELSCMERMCIQSYISQGHEFHLYVYDNVKNVPVGTIIKDANTIISHDKVFLDEFNGYVNFSNLFRYEMLFKNGGWWVDMDTVCLKHFDFVDEFIFSSESSDPYCRFLVNTTFIKSPSNSRFLKDCIEFIEERGVENLHWGELGVNLISRMIFRNGIQKYIQPSEFFCPVSGYRLDLLISDTNYSPSDKTYAIHWWHELWRRNNLNKNSTFSKGSIYERLKNKFQIT